MADTKGTTTDGRSDWMQRVEAKLDALAAAVAALTARPVAATPAGGSAAMPTVDLDNEHGDPEVRFLPRDWKGKDYKGVLFSQTEPAFLDMLAGALAWFADKEDRENATDKKGGPKSKWTRLDAARAAGWADRLRAQGAARAAAPRANGGGKSRAKAPEQPDLMPAHDDDIPF